MSLFCRENVTVELNIAEKIFFATHDDRICYLKSFAENLTTTKKYN